MKKTTIRRRVARYFILMIVFIVIVLGSLDFYENYDIHLATNTEHVDSCSAIVKDILCNLDLEEVQEAKNIKLYQHTRTILRNICKSFKFDYLYVYSIDPDTLRRKRYFNVAMDDETDAFIYKKHLPGSLSETTITPKERSILNGAREIQISEIDNSWGHEISWFIPFTDKNDRLVAIIAIDDNFNMETNEFLRNFLFAVIPMVLAMVFLLILMLRLIGRRVISPISTISMKMLSFANDAEHKPETLNMDSNDEIGEIAASFDKMVNDISMYMKNNEQLTKERLENQVQLDVARRIQYGLVPEHTEIQSKAFSVCAVTRPAKAVGGDFYDCFERDDSTLCIMIGDVSGKGVSAAIFMAMAKTMIREKLMAGCSPAQALNYANDEMCSQNPESLFATVFAAVLDSKTGELCYANAGHTFPVLLKNEPDFLEVDSGIALGLFEDSGLKDYTLRLSGNQGILLYTDGITEANGRDKSFFGTERLLASIKSMSQSAEHVGDTVNGILQSVQNFYDGADQFDDMAILAAFFKPLSENETQNLPVALSSLATIKKTVFGMLGETHLSWKVMLACDEVLANIVNYSGAKNMTFACEKKESRLQVCFSDDGIPFDSTTAKSPEKDFDALDTGGMGLNVIRQVTSEMAYERKDGWNILTLTFA